MENWSIDDKIKAYVFDTTPTNTGQKGGICKLLMNRYGSDVFLLACRHHEMELIIGKAHEIAFGDKSTSPNIELFVQFKSMWNQLDITQFNSSINVQLVKDSIDENERIILIDFIKKQHALRDQSRKDYVEFLDLL